MIVHIIRSETDFNTFNHWISYPLAKSFNISLKLGTVNSCRLQRILDRKMKKWNFILKDMKKSLMIIQKRTGKIKPVLDLPALEIFPYSLFWISLVSFRCWNISIFLLKNLWNSTPFHKFSYSTCISNVIYLKCLYRLVVVCLARVLCLSSKI